MNAGDDMVVIGGGGARGQGAWPRDVLACARGGGAQHNKQNRHGIKVFSSGGGTCIVYWLGWLDVGFCLFHLFISSNLS